MLFLTLSLSSRPSRAFLLSSSDTCCNASIASAAAGTVQVDEVEKLVASLVTNLLPATLTSLPSMAQPPTLALLSWQLRCRPAVLSVELVATYGVTRFYPLSSVCLVSTCAACSS